MSGQPVRADATSTVTFRELTVVRHPGEAPMLGCPSIRRFVEVDEDGLLLVQALQVGKNLQQAERLVQQQTGSEVDALEFVNTLSMKGFVLSLNGQVLDSKDDKQSHGILARSPPHWLRWLRSPILAWLVLGLTLAWVAVVIAEPTIFPRPADVRAAGRPLYIMVSMFGGMLAMAYIHELAHYFMARAFGIQPVIRFSHRFYVLVLQTDVTNAWQLPPRDRLRIFLAGPALNLLVIAAIGLALFWSELFGLSQASISWLRFLGYVNFFPLIFQLMIFGRTDLYFVLLTLMKERNLAQDSRQFLKYKVQRAWKRIRSASTNPCPACGAACFFDDPYCAKCREVLSTADPNRWPFKPRARHKLAWYGVFQVAGQAVMMGFALTFGLLTQLIFIGYGVGVLVQDWQSQKILSIFEGILFLALLVAQLGMLLYFVGQSFHRLGKGMFSRNRQASAIVE